MSQAQVETKQLERETEAYKNLMLVARRMARIEYGKWKIMPSIEDPLRKFTVERDIGWCTIKVGIRMESFYHRTGEWSDRNDFRGEVVIGGMFKDQRGELFIRTGMRVKPRMTKKLMKAINEVIIPKFYNEVEAYKTGWQGQRDALSKFSAELAKVKGLATVNEAQRRYNQPNATLEGCPMRLNVSQEGVSYQGEMSFDDLAKMAQLMKWGGYK